MQKKVDPKITQQLTKERELFAGMLEVIENKNTKLHQHLSKENWFKALRIIVLSRQDKSYQPAHVCALIKLADSYLAQGKPTTSYFAKVDGIKYRNCYLKAAHLYNAALLYAETYQLTDLTSYTELLLSKLAAVEQTFAEAQCAARVDVLNVEQIKARRAQLVSIRQKIQGKITADSESMPVIVKNTTEQLKALFKEIFLETIKLFSNLSLRFAVMGLGSMSRLEMTPYSDVEFAILIKEEKYRDDILRIIQLLQLRLISLGETPFDFELLNSKETTLKKALTPNPTHQGFCMDPGGRHPLGKEYYDCKRRPFKLIGTVEQLSQFVTSQEWQEEDIKFYTQLSRGICICGDQKLLTNYQNKIEKALTDRSKILAILEADLQNFLPQLTTVEQFRDIFTKYGLKQPGKEQEEHLTFSVKHNFYRLLERVIDGIYLYYCPEKVSIPKTVWDKITDLIKLNHLSATGAEQLQMCLNKIMQLRYKTYFYYGSQKENIIHSTFAQIFADKGRKAKITQNILQINDDELLEIYRVLVNLHIAAQRFCYHERGLYAPKEKSLAEETFISDISYFGQAQEYYRQGYYHLASIGYKNLLTVDKTNNELNERYGSCCYLQGDYKKAETSYKQALDSLATQTKDYDHLKARYHRLAGKSLERYLDVNRDQASKEQYRQVIDYYKQALECDAVAISNNELITKLREKAKKMIKAQDWPGVELKQQQFKYWYCDSSSPRISLIEDWLNLSRSHQKLADLEILQDVNNITSYAQARCYLSIAIKHLLKTDDSKNLLLTVEQKRQLYKGFMLLDAKEAEYFTGLKATGQSDKLIKYWQQYYQYYLSLLKSDFKELKPIKFIVLHNLGVIYSAADQPKAKEYYQMALQCANKIQEEEGELIYGEAICLRNLGNYYLSGEQVKAQEPNLLSCKELEEYFKRLRDYQVNSNRVEPLWHYRQIALEDSNLSKRLKKFESNNRKLNLLVQITSAFMEEYINKSKNEDLCFSKLQCENKKELLKLSTMFNNSEAKFKHNSEYYPINLLISLLLRDASRQNRNVAIELLRNGEFTGMIYVGDGQQKVNLKLLSHKNLRSIPYIEFAYANFRGADLSNLDFSSCNLYCANFSESILSNADFTGACLINSNFAKAKCQGTKFAWINGYRANFANIEEQPSSWDGANLIATKFSDNFISKLPISATREYKSCLSYALSTTAIGEALKFEELKKSTKLRKNAKVVIANFIYNTDNKISLQVSKVCIDSDGVAPTSYEVNAITIKDVIRIWSKQLYDKYKIKRKDYELIVDNVFAEIKWQPKLARCLNSKSQSREYLLFHAPNKALAKKINASIKENQDIGTIIFSDEADYTISNKLGQVIYLTNSLAKAITNAAGNIIILCRVLLGRVYYDHAAILQGIREIPLGYHSAYGLYRLKDHPAGDNNEFIVCNLDQIYPLCYVRFNEKFSQAKARKKIASSLIAETRGINYGEDGQPEYAYYYKRYGDEIAAIAQNNLRMLQQAVYYYDLALALNKSDASTYLSLAKIYGRLGCYREMVHAYNCAGQISQLLTKKEMCTISLELLASGYYLPQKEDHKNWEQQTLTALAQLCINKTVTLIECERYYWQLSWQQRRIFYDKFSELKPETYLADWLYILPKDYTGVRERTNYQRKAWNKHLKRLLVEKRKPKKNDINDIKVAWLDHQGQLHYGILADQYANIMFNSTGEILISTKSDKSDDSYNIQIELSKNADETSKISEDWPPTDSDKICILFIYQQVEQDQSGTWLISWIGLDILLTLDDSSNLGRFLGDKNYDDFEDDKERKKLKKEIIAYYTAKMDIGRCIVKCLKDKHGVPLVYVKFYPHFPLRQYAYDELTYRLSGYGAMTTLAKIVHPKQPDKPYAVLLSRPLGKTLLQLRQSNSDQGIKYDGRAFSWKLLENLILQPGDEKDDNLAVVPICDCNDNIISYRLISFDNDHMMPQQTVEKGCVQVNSITYLLPKMEEKLARETIVEYLNVDVLKLLNAWWKGLCRYSRKIVGNEALFMQESAANICKQEKCDLTAAFCSLDISSLYSRMWRLQQLLREYPPQSTNQTLFNVFEPDLASYYQDQAVKKYANPYERFQHLPNNIKTKRDQWGTQISESQMPPPGRPSLLTWLKKAKANDYLTIGEINEKHTLIDVENYYIYINKVSQTTAKGKLAEFSQAGNFAKEIIINYLNWPEISTDSANKILTAVATVSFRRLDLAGCKNLTDKQIRPLLKNSLEMRDLNICYCQKLTNTTIKNIEKYCPSLEKLKAAHLPNIEMIKGNFNFLRYLYVNDCSNLATITINTPLLSYFNAAKCKKLTTIKTASKQMTVLNLEYCLQLSKDVFLSIIADDDCQLIIDSKNDRYENKLRSKVEPNKILIINFEDSERWLFCGYNHNGEIVKDEITVGTKLYNLLEKRQTKTVRDDDNLIKNKLKKELMWQLGFVPSPLKMKWLNLNGCKNIQHRQFYEEFPYLFNLPLSKWSTSTVTTLRNAILRALSDHGLRNDALSYIVKNLVYNTVKKLLDNYNTVIALLVKALAKGEDETKIKATKMLAILSKLDQQKVILALIVALKDDDWVMEKAAKALGKVVQSDPKEVIPVLIAVLKDDKRYYVRKEAAEALGKVVQSDPKEVIPALILALKDDKRYYVRKEAAEALGNVIQSAPREVIPALIAALKGDNKYVRMGAMEALGNIVQNAPKEVISALIETVKGDDINVSMKAAKVLRNIVQSSPKEVGPVLIAALNDDIVTLKDDYVFYAGWKAAEVEEELKKVGQNVPERVSPAALKGDDKHVRRKAAKALGKSTPKEVIPALIAALKDDDWAVKEKAAKALGNVGQSVSKEVIPALIAALRDDDWAVKESREGVRKNRAKRS